MQETPVPRNSHTAYPGKHPTLFDDSEKLDLLEEQVRKRDAEMLIMSDELRRAKDEETRMNAELLAGKRKIAELQTSLKREKDAKEKTAEELEEKIAKIASMSAQNSMPASSTPSDLEDRLKQQKNLVKEWTKKGKAFEDRATAAETALEEQSGVLDTWKKHFRIHVSRLRIEIEQLKKYQSSTQKTVLDQMAKSKIDGEDRMRSLNEEITRLRETLRDRDRQSESTKAASKEKEDRLEKVQAERDSFVGEIKRLRAAAEANEAQQRRERQDLALQIAELKSQVNQKEREIQGLHLLRSTAAAVQPETAKRPATSNHKTHDGGGGGGGAADRSLEAERSKYKTRIRTLEKSVESLEREKDMLITSLQKEKERQGRITQEAKADAQGRVKEKKILEDRVRQLEAENQELKEALLRELVEMRNHLAEEDERQRRLEDEKTQLMQFVRPTTSTNGFLASSSAPAPDDDKFSEGTDPACSAPQPTE
eukprot:ANDGO_00799.mRNA.1 hypothetical protein